MSLINYLLIALAIIIPGGIPLYLYWQWRSKKFREAEEELKTSINNFTDTLVEAAQDGINQSEIKTSPSGVKYKTVEGEYLSNPKYLTTLLTTIIKKYDSIILTEEDFADVTKKDYASLYIDLKTNNIILKANNYEEPEEVAPRVYETPEEDIYH
jgi:hypothetical protein